ncbi:MAG: hypothetical protein HQ548_07350 [Chloroflexi bacterium]|nr:hypothetical protein [Chloroflexota bacterium]
MDPEEQEDSIEARIAVIEDELELLKDNVLPMLLDIRERLLTRDGEV